MSKENVINSDDARSRILEAARSEFADKGFDGARVDKIAESAEVNKALIYYYFGSKRDLLTALYEQLVENAVKAMRSSSLVEALRAQASRRSDETAEMKELVRQFLEYFQGEKEILRILFMESLKGAGENYLLQLTQLYFDGPIQQMVEELKDSGVHIDSDRTQWIMTEFFTAIMPLITYGMFRDEFCDRLGISTKEADAYFMRSMEETHFRSHFPDQKNE